MPCSQAHPELGGVAQAEAPIFCGYVPNAPSPPTTRQRSTLAVNDERPTDGSGDVHPALQPHPFTTQPAPLTPPVYTEALRNDDLYTRTASAPQSTPPTPPGRRSWLFYTAWIAGGVLVVALVVQAALFAASFVTDAASEFGFAEQSGTVLSEAWNVDGVDVVYVESGGTECEEYCWEWLLMTRPDCETANVTVEISDGLLGEAQRTVERSVTIEQVTSVLVEIAPDDGEFADLTAISCD
jgi:hypothetical protein